MQVPSVGIRQDRTQKFPTNITQQQKHTNTTTNHHHCNNKTWGYMVIPYVQGLHKSIMNML